MPFDALSANASEIVPVGAIDSRWLLRMPCARIASWIGSGRRDAKRGDDRYASVSRRGKAPLSFAMSTDAMYAASRMASAMRAAIARPSSAS